MVISPNKWELDVQGYLNLCNITSATPRKQIRDFAAGVNDLGLWNSMVCWPLRSSQNAGTGTTALSLGGLGTYNGTLVNGPTWGADGLSFVTASATRVTISLQAALGMSVISVAQHTAYGAASGDYSSTWGIVNSQFATRGTENFITGASGSRNYSRWIYTPSIQNISTPISSMGGEAGFLTSYFFDQRTFGNSSYKLRLNANQTNNVAQTAFMSGVGGFILGANGSNNRTMTGIMPFFAVFTADIHDVDLYSLYKTTLGTGLGLP